MQNLIEVRNLKKYFHTTPPSLVNPHPPIVRAVDGVSFAIGEGETLGIVGESGCGKSTLGRTLIRLYDPDDGSILFNGTDISSLKNNDLIRHRRNFQMIFQDPYASLNPRMTAGSIVAEGLEVYRNRGILKLSRKEIDSRVKELFDLVGLSPQFQNRYPHEFSGGQRQRIGIARALALSPSFIVCDEPVSALDVSIQAQIINLLEKLQAELKLTYLFISHDLAVIKHISSRIAVMYLGKIVEIAGASSVYQDSLHPYTLALLSDAPIPDPALERKRKRILLKGELPSPTAVFTGCRFKSRCFLKTDICETVEPRLEDKGSGHFAACHHSDLCRGVIA